MTELWILVIIAAFAVASSLAFLAIYGAIVISSRNSRREEREAQMRTVVHTNGTQGTQNGQPAEPAGIDNSRLARDH